MRRARATAKSAQPCAARVVYVVHQTKIYLRLFFCVVVFVSLFSVLFQARTGEVCGQPPRVMTAVPLDCPSFIRGWGSGPDINVCFKYARQRTQECTAGAICSNSPALCPVMLFNTGSAAHLLPCVSSPCKQSCTAGDSIATVTQNNICFTNQVVAGCTDIGCRALVSGWSGATCRKWNLDHVGYCESQSSGAAFSGRCSSDSALCALQSGQTEVLHQQCADINCVVATACQPNTPLTSNDFTTVCNTNVVVNGCPDILCSNYVRGWNMNTCERYQVSLREIVLWGGGIFSSSEIFSNIYFVVFACLLFSRITPATARRLATATMLARAATQ